MIYAITGATGHIGGQIADILLENRKSVRAIGRNGDKLKQLAAKGAEVYSGNLDDSAFLARAFDKVESVFAMIPPNPKAEDFREFQNTVGTAIAAALVKAGVRRVVNLSSQGAHLRVGTGPIAGLYDQEQRLNAIQGLQLVHLRPAFFMENLMMNIGLIRKEGINGSPMKGDIPIPMIATCDIATAAAEQLQTVTVTGGKVHDLLGQRDLSMNEVTRILGAAIGKPDLTYFQFPYETAEKAMVAMGLSADMASLYIEMYRAFNERRIMSDVRRDAENTTATSIEAFAPLFMAAYNKG